MTYEAFCDMGVMLYEQLPEQLKEQFALSFDTYPCERHPHGEVFGEWLGFTPNMVHLCYAGFLRHGDFSREHIARVLKHEFEHTRFGVLKHSEH